MEETIVQKKMTPSKYQVAIYDKIANTNDNVAVSASAGSGKTTTIVEGSKLIPHNKATLFAAFNKSIVEELSKRLPPHVECRTLHSLGMTSLMSHFRVQLKINEYKTFPIIEEIIKAKTPEQVTRENEKALIAYKYAMRDAIDLVRMTLTEWNVDALFEMCCRYDVELLQPEMEDIIQAMKKLEVYNRSFNKKHCHIDYVDMIYIPATSGKIKLPSYDVIFVDESQDLNRSQHQFLERIISSKGRMISVGDKNQSIYGFMGSDLNSFNRFAQRPNTTSLPLSISYRCGTDIVKAAQQVYPDIEPNPSNPKGEIRYGNVEEIEPGDMVLCRNNRPLAFLYFELLREEKNPVIIGSDIEIGLEALISKVVKKSSGEGLELLYERLLAVKEELKGKGVKNISEHPRYQSLKDKVQTIEIIAERFDTMKEVKAAIKDMFKEKENCIKLMTIHKSKGLEADRVFYIERFDGQKLLPSPYATREWEKLQEKNLQFVMLTRAKTSLIFINNINSK
jgi:DNA helicase-2/ATP-dependent DNA helicase PcrA